MVETVETLLIGIDLSPAFGCFSWLHPEVWCFFDSEIGLCKASKEEYDAGSSTFEWYLDYSIMLAFISLLGI